MAGKERWTPTVTNNQSLVQITIYFVNYWQATNESKRKRGPFVVWGEKLSYLSDDQYWQLTSIYRWRVKELQVNTTTDTLEWQSFVLCQLEPDAYCGNSVTHVEMKNKKKMTQLLILKASITHSINFSSASFLRTILYLWVLSLHSVHLYKLMKMMSKFINNY